MLVNGHVTCAGFCTEIPQNVFCLSYLDPSQTTGMKLQIRHAALLPCVSHAYFVDNLRVDGHINIPILCFFCGDPSSVGRGTSVIS